MKKRNVAVINDNNTISLYIGRGQWAVVDTVDLPKIAKHKWSALPAGRHGYYAKATVRIEKKATTLLMQHVVKPKRAGKELDHKDRNKLNNTRKNLRYVSHAVNMRNVTSNSRNKSGVTGVSWNKKGKVWVVTAGTKIYKSTGKRRPFYVGGFKKIDEAIAARNKAVKRLRGYTGSNIV